MTRVGLQLGAQHARAVVLAGWPRRRVQAVEVPFDPEHPDEAIANLGALLGTPKRIAVAVDLQLLRTKRVSLPALPAAERRNILQLEPERFFAVRGDEIVPAVRANDGLVFAVAAPVLTRWIEAIERIAPVDLGAHTVRTRASARRDAGHGRAGAVRWPGRGHRGRGDPGLACHERAPAVRHGAASGGSARG
jgi:hypothetical protein